VSRSSLLILLGALLLLGSLTHVGHGTDREVIAVSLTGTITKASAELVREAVEAAEQSNAEAVLILLDTPGGDLDATMRIMEIMDRSTVPVIAYVHPQGAKAWSAGTFILISAHIAAMAPHTIIGSSQPVRYSPTGSEPIDDPKIINALSALIAERARMHSRNETATTLFVTANLNLNDETALRLKVIEVRASNIGELLAVIDNRQVATARGTVRLQTRSIPVSHHSTSLRVLTLSVISDPILSFLFLTIGLYALIFGLASPGHAAEIVGAFTLVVGLIGLGFDVNLGGVVLISLGAVLMIVEAYTPGFGIFGGAGLFCVAVGGLLLVPLQRGRWLISPEWYSFFLMLIGAVVSVLGAFTLFMVYKIVQARRRRPITGGLIGETIEVVDEITPDKPGYVKYRGEYWRAHSNSTLKAGTTGQVVGKEGPILIVEPKWPNVNDS